MSESAKLSFSREHRSSSHPNLHTDSYRRTSSSPDTVKTGHNDCEPQNIELHVSRDRGSEESNHASRHNSVRDRD